MGQRKKVSNEKIYSSLPTPYSHRPAHSVLSCINLKHFAISPVTGLIIQKEAAKPNKLESIHRKIKYGRFSIPITIRSQDSGIIQMYIVNTITSDHMNFYFDGVLI